MTACGAAGDGEVGHVDLLRGEVGRPAGFAWRQGTAEKGELEAVFAAVLTGQIAGVVPPLGGVVVVGTVVAWKLEFERLKGAGEAVTDRTAEDVDDIG